MRPDRRRALLGVLLGLGVVGWLAGASPGLWASTTVGGKIIPGLDGGAASIAGLTPTTTPTTTTIPGYTAKTDTAIWDTWVAGPGRIGSTYLTPVYNPDVLYVSTGPTWVNIDWTTVVAGDRIQILSPDGLTLYQDWTVTTPWVVAGPGGHVDVSGGAPLISPATNTSVLTTVLHPLVVPATVGADTNCAANNIPVPNQDGPNAWNGYMLWGETCPSGSNAAGYDVTGVSVYVNFAGLGAHLKCSVYTNATPNAHVAAGCDTSEAVLPQNPNAWITLPTTGACHLAPGTRYWAACATSDNSTIFKQVSTACPTCWKYAGSQPYASLWPATVTSTGSYNLTLAVYLGITPTGAVLTTTGNTVTGNAAGNLPPCRGSASQAGGGATRVAGLCWRNL